MLRADEVVPPTAADGGRLAPTSGDLDATRRESTLRALEQETFDLLVVGGGITGVGAALDAASRGLRVALVEAGDLGGGTSSRSSRLLHGGVRYLEQLELGLVREALRERALLADRLAPHLVRRLRFVYPLRHRLWERAYVGAGLTLYDELGRSAGTSRSGFRRHRHLSRSGLAREVPLLRAELTAGALEYDDGQVDDARLTIAVARTAAREGAVIATRVRAVGYQRDRQAAIVTVRDELSGATIVVRARQVLGASGVWTEQLQQLVGTRALRVRASKGVHLVVPAAVLPADRALITRAGQSVLFVIPTGDTVLVGTTDTPYDGDPSAVAADADDVDYLLRQVNTWLRRPLSRDDVAGVYAGLRPLVEPARTAGRPAPTARISREHVVSILDDRWLAVAGGKLTTYRVMARDAVDAVVERLGGTHPASCTHQLPLVGADGVQAIRNRRAQLARDHDLDADTLDALLGRHGSEVLGLLGSDPEGLFPVTATSRLLRAEVENAVRREGALTVEDVLLRRCRSGQGVVEDPGAAPEVARLMAGVLGRDDAWQRAEVGRYRELLASSHRALAAAMP